MERNRKVKDEMKDNRMVKDNHQEGISRVIQRKGTMQPGQGGKMHGKPIEKAHWKRSDDDLSPRRA